MRKTTTRIVCIAIFLIATLALGHKVFMESGDHQTHPRTDIVSNNAAGKYSGNQYRKERGQGIPDRNDSIGGVSTGNEGAIFAAVDSIGQNKDAFVYDCDDSIARYTGNNEEITWSYSGCSDSGLSHADSGSSASTRPAGSIPGNAGHFYAGGGDAGGSSGSSGNTGRKGTRGNSPHGNGGWGNGAGSSGSGGGNGTGRTGAGDSPITSTGSNPVQGHPPTNQEDKNNQGQTGKLAGEDHGNNQDEPIAAPNKGDTEPEFFDGTPGNAQNNPPQPHIPAGTGNPGNETIGTAENPGTQNIPEPTSILLIIVGGVMLLWSRRRGHPARVYLQQH
ncbi:PEP-CTERM sorting domain-containing protein [uncultured Nitrosomonas sp.]|uniref:PEP-CTERM sorting domain-containing protein n=1 Tax=uncultured Nitrosomonas sp. TaxID=156424 RepID=UPI002612AFDD|nr:PEP-CTERM sorting domain-containing protein [uncultured Nitrosomonas sp.]